MDTTTDEFEVKVQKAREALPAVTRHAIDAVNWRSILLIIKEEQKYSIDQIGALETETELLLCGLLDPQQYPKELQARMGLTKLQMDELVVKMNEMVFKKIQEVLMKSTEDSEADLDVPPPPYAGMMKPAATVPPVAPLPVASVSMPKPMEKAAAPHPQANTQSGILGTAGIEMINTPAIQAQPETQPVTEASIKGDEMVMEKSGIDVLADKTVPTKSFAYTPSSREETISGIENPPTLASSIIGAKLKGTIVAPKTVSDHTISKEAPLAPSAHTDPYREPLE